MRRRQFGSIACDGASRGVPHFESDGLDIEDSQIESAARLFNIAALGLVAAARIRLASAFFG